MGEPSWGLRNRTPSSVTLASLSRETIWKLHREHGQLDYRVCASRRSYPPLSVKRFRSHPCNLCAPPTASSTSCPGFNPRWYVLFKQSIQPVSRSWSYVRPLRAACVATGMKIGRGTSPWGSFRVLARALVVWKE